MGECMPDIVRFFKYEDVRAQFADSNLFVAVDNMMEDQQTFRAIKLQLAVLKDIGAHLVKTTYNLEGTKHMTLEADAQMRLVRDFLAADEPHLPTAYPILANLATRDPLTDWAAKVSRMWHPVRTYILTHFYGNETADNSVGKMCFLYKHFYPFAALFNPRYSRDVTAAMVAAVRGKLPFLSDADVDALLVELPWYTSLRQLNPDVEADEVRGTGRGHTTTIKSGICAWWKRMAVTAHQDIPTWIKVFKRIILMQPSSAEVERIFSLKRLFDGQRRNMLLDFLETAVMLRHNLYGREHDDDWLACVLDLYDPA